MKRRNFIKSLVVGTYIACGIKLMKPIKVPEQKYYLCNVEFWTADRKVTRFTNVVNKDQCPMFYDERGNYPKSMGITGKEEVVFWEPK